MFGFPKMASDVLTTLKEDREMSFYFWDLLILKYMTVRNLDLHSPQTRSHSHVAFKALPFPTLLAVLVLSTQ